MKQTNVNAVVIALGVASLVAATMLVMKHAALQNRFVLVATKAAPTTTTGAAFRTEPDLHPARLRDLKSAKWEQYPHPLFEYLPQSLSNRSNSSSGHAARVEHCSNCFDVISYHPYVVVFDNIVTPAEADELIHAGEKLLQRSGVVGGGVNRARTSSGARLPKNHPIAAAVDKRLLDAVNLFETDKARRPFKAGNAERLYLLRYNGNEKYNGHADNFGGIAGPIMKAFRAKQKEGAGFKLDRAATFLVYLSDLPEGHGVTAFPHSSVDDSKSTNATVIDAILHRFDSRKENACASNGTIALTPKVGRGVLFYDLFENGVADPYSMHAGCPVGTDIEGTKWLITKWFMIPLDRKSVV